MYVMTLSWYREWYWHKRKNDDKTNEIVAIYNQQ